MVTGINIGSFPLGEADKVLTVFTAERGILRAVAKGARKPGGKLAGRADILHVNRLLLATGKTFEIITQAQTIESFPELRSDLCRLAWGLYYAELSGVFGAGLAEESAQYLDYLLAALRLLARCSDDPTWLGLVFEIGLLERLGYLPELTYCVVCRAVLTDYSISLFHREAGGIVCNGCARGRRVVAEVEDAGAGLSWNEGTYVTPAVWRALVLALASGDGELPGKPGALAVQAAQRLVHGYLEHRCGRHLQALDLLGLSTIRSAVG
jgi:DNA repair protein RecO